MWSKSNLILALLLTLTEVFAGWGIYVAFNHNHQNILAADVKANKVPAVVISPELLQKAKRLGETDLPQPPQNSAEELAELSTEVPIDVLNKVAEKQKQFETRALPADEKEKLAANALRKKQAWSRRLIVDSYEKVGIHDVAWDEPARKLLDAYSPYLATTILDEKEIQSLAALADVIPDSCDDPLVLYCVAMVRLSQQQFPEVLALLERAVLKYPDTQYPYALRRFAIEQMAALCDRAFNRADDPRIPPLQERGLRETLAEKGLRLFPEDTELRFREAMLHHHFGRLEQAVNSYREVLSLQQERYFASVDTGVTGYKARHNLAIVHEELGQWDEAETQWRAVIEQIPHYRPAWHGLGQLFLRTGQSTKIQRLLADLEQIADSNTDLPIEALVLRAALDQADGDIDAAPLSLQRAVHQSPSDVDALQALARLLFENHGPAHAEHVLIALVKANPEDPSAWHNLATVLRENSGSCPHQADRCYALAVRGCKHSQSRVVWQKNADI